MATITDVARLANVSTATVSRVLAGNYPVSEKTRTAVLNAVQALHYTPNLAGQSLRGKTGDTVYVIFSDMQYSEQICIGVQDALRKNNLNFVLIRIPDEKKEQHQLDILFRAIGYGVIVLERSCLTEQDLIRLREHYPIAQFGKGTDDSLFNGVVSLDNERAGYEMASHLFAQGARSLVYPLIAEKMHNPSSYSNEREEGVRAAAKEAGLPPDAVIPFLCPYPRAEIDEKGFAFGRQMAAQFSGRLPDAFLCFWDSVAVGCIQGLELAGFRVPEDVMVSGFEGKAFAAHFIPAVTTLLQPYYEIGTELVRVLIEAKESGQVGLFENLPGRLVQRASTTRDNHREAGGI